MTGGFRKDPNDKLTTELTLLRQQVNALLQKQTVVPILDTDPDPTQPGNIWVFADGRLRVRLYDGTIKEWAAVAVPGSGTSGTPKPVRPSGGTTLRNQWVANWSQSYQDDGSARADYPERLWIGNYVGILGNNAALIGFDWADIQTQLVGAEITGVRVYYSNAYANQPAGIHTYWGTHNNPTQPAVWQSVVDYPIADRWYGPSEAGWTSLPSWVGEEFRDSAAFGLLVAGGDGVGVNGWGYGVTTTTPPILEITYVK
jgi:hypothetical protein